MRSLNRHAGGHPGPEEVAERASQSSAWPMTSTSRYAVGAVRHLVPFVPRANRWDKTGPAVQHPPDRGGVESRNAEAPCKHGDP